MKSVQKDGFFDATFDLFKEKKFSSLWRDNELFWELKTVKNGRNHSKFRKTVFYKQILDFHCPSKILCHTFMKFCQNHWSLLLGQLLLFLNNVYLVNPADGIPLHHGKVHLVADKVPENKTIKSTCQCWVESKHIDVGPTIHPCGSESTS